MTVEHATRKRIKQSTTIGRLKPVKTPSENVVLSKEDARAVMGILKKYQAHCQEMVGEKKFKSWEQFMNVDVRLQQINNKITEQL